MIEKDFADKYCIFKCLSGSHAYGTSLPTSDVDTRGVFIAPPSHILSCVNSVEQVEDRTTDTTIFELKKFLKLAAECNPNIIELLFVDEENILLMHPLWDQIRKNRHLFLSKKARHTFSGYAMSQLKRIRGHHKWINNPKPEKNPVISDYCKFIKNDGTIICDGDAIREVSKTSFLVETFGTTHFRVFQSPGYFAEKLGFYSADEIQIKSIDVHDDILKEKATYLGVLIVNVNEFSQEHLQWKQYWDWKKNRNKDRSALEEQFGMDCYSADTEFLTKLGWKRYDDIDKNIQLATINPLNHQVEYQSYLERHDAIYTGNMYSISGHHTDIRVSSNHRMYVRPYSRTLEKQGQWSFLRVCDLPDTFDVLSRVNPKYRQHLNDEPCGLTLQHYLRLMGWYVSEGNVSHRLNDGSPSVLTLSQLKGGRLHWHISRAINSFAKMGVTIREYSYYRKSKNKTEMRWTIAHRELSKRLVAECGDKSVNKRLPRWVMHLSARMQRILLISMWLGDGSSRKSERKEYLDRKVYYTSSPQLADDVNELALLSGLETSKWGPYNGMYQIHFNGSANLYRRLMRFQNIQSDPVKNERIVCFTVPNEILITRRNGKIAIQGNSKHAMHLVRLMKMCEEILLEKTVKVKRPDAQELLDIRNGKLEYSSLIKWAKEFDQKLDAIYEKSTLPYSADYVAIDELYRKTVLSYWNSHNLLKTIP